MGYDSANVMGQATKSNHNQQQPTITTNSQQLEYDGDNIYTRMGRYIYNMMRTLESQKLCPSPVHINTVPKPWWMMVDVQSGVGKKFGGVFSMIGG